MARVKPITFGNYKGTTFTVTVRPSALLRVRTRIGLWLIWLGCRIATVGYARELGDE